VRDCTLGRYTEVGARTILQESALGDYSYIVHDGEAAYTSIGRFCSIASHVRLNPGNHPMERASQAHFSYRASAYWPGEEDEAEFFAWRSAWRRRRSRCLDRPRGRSPSGPHHRHGCSGGSGRHRDARRRVYTIVVGNPARPVRRRFQEDIAERLLALAWWDWDHERLRRALPDFRRLPVEAFLDAHEG
jgi:acetyltransferase-like isoleucine patch superfamily enzyme